jgi:outer membrane protein OmpA-like peptidoglycan-associated protein
MKKIIISLSLLLSSIAIFAQTEIPMDDKAMIINEATINGTNFEYSPAFFENGIVFISTDKTTKNKVTDKSQKGNKGVSIQVARRGPEGILAAPELFAQNITSAYNDGPMCFDQENKTMIYSTNNVKNGKKMKSKKGIIRQRLVMSTFDGKEWTAPVDLPFNNEEFDNLHPSLSADGNILYFASNRPGGAGGMDIYLAKKNGDTWGEPINLGADINTEKNDAFPFIHADGTLFYASDGKSGMGGLDVFFSNPNKDGTFVLPKNLGKPYNSAGDDFGLIVDLEGKNGYFSSNRSGGKGEDDIYSFHTDNVIAKEKGKNTCKVTAYIVEKERGKEVEGASIKIMNISDYEIGEVLTDNSGNIIKLTSNDSTNILTSVKDNEAVKIVSNVEGRADLSFQNGKYLLNISKNGYQEKQILINGCQDRDEILVLLEKLSDNTIPMVGTLRGNRGNPIPNSTVTLTDEKTGETQVIQTDNQGKFKYFVKPNADYKLSATKDNFLATSMKFNTKNMDKNSPELPIKMEMTELVNTALPEGKIFQLNNVYYNYNDATLRPDAKLDLDPLVALLKTYSDVEIELSSHTDSRGKDTYNQQLSQRRAESAAKYLTDRGIAGNRIKAVGYGETQLRNGCRDGVACDEAQHKINRRTEVKITKAPSDLDVSVVDKYYQGSGSSNSAPSNVLSESNSSNNNNTTASNSNSAANSSSNSTNGSSSTPNSYSPAAGEYWIVAGSYQNVQNADDQAASLSRKGYVPTVIYAEDIHFYRVLVSKTNSLSDARKLLKILKAQREPAFALRG